MHGKQHSDKSYSAWFDRLLLVLLVVALAVVALALGRLALNGQPVAVEYHCVSDRGCDGLFYLADDEPLGAWVTVQMRACVVEAGIDGGVWLAADPAISGACGGGE